MRLAVNGRFLGRSPTGVDRVAMELLLALDRMLVEEDQLTRGLEVEILAPSSASRDLPLRRIGTRSVGRLGGHGWEQTELAIAARGAWLLNPCNTGPVAISRSVTIIHDAQVFQTPQSYSRAFRALYRVELPLLARRSRLVFTVSDFSRSELERYGVAPPGKLRVSHNGCDHMDRICADPKAPGRFNLDRRPYFLALGSLSPHKNLATLLRADRRRKNEGERPLICVVGGGNPRIFANADLPGDHDVHFCGRVSDEELKSLLMGAHALLFPSHFEGFGLPPLEAMRCGCPVIASTASAVREVCGDAALYVEPDDVDGWARAMDKLADDRSIREGLSAAGLKRSEQFRWEDAARRLLEAIRGEEG